MLCPISSIFYQNCFKDAWNSIPVVEVTSRAMSKRSRSSEALPYQGDTGYGPIRAGNSLAELPGLQADGAGLNHTFSWQMSKTLSEKGNTLDILDLIIPIFLLFKKNAL